MSRRLLLAAAFLLCAASMAQGQSLEQLERRARILTAKNDLLRDSLRLMGEENFGRQPRVTIAGAVFAVAAPDWAAPSIARDVAEDGARWRDLYGSAFDVLKKDTLVVWIADPDTSRPQDARKAEWRFAGVSGTTVLYFGAYGGYDPLSVFPWLAVMGWERSLLDSATTSWLGTPLTGTGLEGVMHGTRSALLYSDAGPARRCLEGRIADCERLLDLDSPADSVTRWYDASDKAWGRAIQHVRNDVRGRVACTSGRTANACAALLRAERVSMTRPVGNVVRESFYRFAIAAGGDGALQRLQAHSGGTVAEDLSAAAGRPVGELVPEWRAWLDQGRPHPQGGLVTSVLLALGWMAVLVLLFAWRFRWIRA